VNIFSAKINSLSRELSELYEKKGEKISEFYRRSDITTKNIYEDIRKIDMLIHMVEFEILSKKIYYFMNY